MQVRLKKGRDGPDSLACVRDDGTSTWRRIQRGLALHDLAHYAVETEIEIPDGFFGLVETGWNLEDLADAEERSRIPPGSIWVEFLVNTFITEAAGGELYEADAFNESVSKSAAKLGIAAPRELGAEEIARVRGNLLSLVARWRALPPGETLELTFRAETPRPPSERDRDARRRR
jgi:hypothetical protein